METNGDQHFVFRSPFQVALLMTFTAGFYGIYWSLRNRWIAENRLNRKNFSPYLWFLFIMPIVNIYIFVKYIQNFSLIEKSLSSNKLKPRRMFALLALVGHFTYLNSYFIPNMQKIICEDRFNQSKTAKFPKLTIIEIIAITPGILFLALITLGFPEQDLNNKLFTILVWSIQVVGPLFWYFRVTKSIEARYSKSQNELHANPT